MTRTRDFGPTMVSIRGNVYEVGGLLIMAGLALLTIIPGGEAAELHSGGSEIGIPPCRSKKP